MFARVYKQDYAEQQELWLCSENGKRQETDAAKDLSAIERASNTTPRLLLDFAQPGARSSA